MCEQSTLEKTCEYMGGRLWHAKRVCAFFDKGDEQYRLLTHGAEVGLGSLAWLERLRKSGWYSQSIARLMTIDDLQKLAVLSGSAAVNKAYAG